MAVAALGFEWRGFLSFVWVQGEKGDDQLQTMAILLLKSLHVREIHNAKGFQ